jgi:hypothetical protein
MGIFRLFRFFTEARQYAQLDPEQLRQAGASAPRHQSYHRRVVWTSAIAGLVVATIGTLGLLNDKPANDRDARLVYYAPFLFGAAGMLLGVALACMLAPTEFLTGPMGSRWMALIGTKSTGAARFVCLLIVLIIGGVSLFLALAHTLQERGLLAPPRNVPIESER